MAADTLLDLSAVELARLFETRQLSPVEVVQAVQQRLDETEPTLNAFISRRDAEALAEAKLAEQEILRGSYRGPLHGVPVAVKDNLAVAGTVTTGGARFLATNHTAEDAEAVRRLRAAGAIVVGKANLHEFAYGATTINPHYGTTRNPWRTDHIASGSSGGSAAAVAGRQLPLAVGTDAAGSIRMPASVCGIVGVKPTFGRVSVRGLLASHNSTVDHVGPMTRTVADAALMLEHMAGFDPLDPTCIDRPVPAYRTALDTRDDLRGVRVGVPTNYYFDLIDPDVEAVVRSAIGELQRLGATLDEVAIPDLEEMMPLRLALFAEGLAFHGRHLREHLDEYGEMVRRRFLVDHFVTARDYALAQRVRRLLQMRFGDAFSQVDLIAAPATGITAVPITADEVTVRDTRAGQAVVHNPALFLLRNTAPANLTGVPAISIPAGFAPKGLPVGLQLMARPFEEPLMLAVAHVYEQAMGWYKRRPGLIAEAPAAG